MDTEAIAIKYGLPKALPTVQNGKLAPVWPLNFYYRGDNVLIFSKKYMGEIEHIYELLYRVSVHESLDPDNPLPYEFKFEGNNFYIRDGTNTKWTLIGDVTKLHLGAHEELLAKLKELNDQIQKTYIKNLSANGGTLTITRGDNKTESITIDNVNNALHANTADSATTATNAKHASSADIATLATTATKAMQDSKGQEIVSTYIKGLANKDATITITRGDGTTSTITINNVEFAKSADIALKDNLGQQIDKTYVKSVEEKKGIVTVTKGNNDSNVFYFTPITDDIIDDVFRLVEDTSKEPREPIPIPTIEDIVATKGEGYITEHSIDTAVDTNTIDDIFTKVGAGYPDPTGDESILTDEIDKNFK